jgi:hypothetical protein
MKKLFLSITAAFMSVSCAMAQQDSAKQQPVTQPVQPPEPTTPSRIQDQYRQPDRVIVPQDQLPQAMRLTLEENQYKGWENSTIYQDRTTGEYFLDVFNTSNTSKTYRFDRNGRLVEDPNKPKPGIENDGQ